MVLALLPLALLALLAVSVADVGTARTLFVHTTYYFMLGTVLVWAGTLLGAVREWSWAAVRGFCKENWPGVLAALAVTLVAAFAVEPALRILSDEANLVGTSKNLFASKTATFTVSGKFYYGSYWDVDVAIDRRPTLFPFLVSLLHALGGYSYRNAFALNLLLLPVFVFTAYRLAKSLATVTHAGTAQAESTAGGVDGGPRRVRQAELFGLAAALFVVAHPIALISVRSAGFDFLATFFALLVMKSLFDFLLEQRPVQLAVLWMNLCMFAEVRYESALFLPLVVLLLVAFRLLKWSALRPYAFVYALTPAFLLPRAWQALLRGNVPEQEPGTVTFSVENFLNNAWEYFAPVLEPFHSYPAHSGALIALGLGGAGWGLHWLGSRERERSAPAFRFGVAVTLWMALQAFLVFTYYWGRAQYPSAARLVLPMDVFFSFAAAWFSSRLLVRFGVVPGLLVAFGLFVTEVPHASQHRMLNRLTQTRESAATWEFFERLHEQRILIVTDRPSHFALMNYGAMSFEAARNDTHLFTALERRLFADVYVIQQLRLSTKEPLPGYELWPEREMQPVFEFQNDADVLVRVSRVSR